MDRLTFKFGDKYAVKCADVNENTYYDENFKNAESYYQGKVIDKLAHYENSEEKGLLVELPCNVGDTVGGKEVEEIRINKEGTTLIYLKGYVGMYGGIGLTTERLNITETHLCNNCEFLFPECSGKDIVFGNGKGHDNVVMCDCYKEQALKEMEK